MRSRISAIIIAMLLFGTLFFTVGTASAKTDVGGIDVTLSTSSTNRGDDELELDVGENFYVHILLEDPEDDDTGLDIDIKITINGVKVYDDDERDVDVVEGEEQYIVIGSSKFEDDWEENLMDYECGSESVDVAISGDVNKESDDDAEIDIDGDDLNIDIDPEDPSVDSKITVTVTDDDDDELDDITVKFTHLGDDDDWDDGDESWDDETDNDGEVEVELSEESAFDDDPYGRYQIDVWEDKGDFCKVTRTIDLKRSLIIKEITPSKPVAGSATKVKITDESDRGVSGARVTVNSAGFHQTYTTDSGGFVSFTLSNEGNYVLIASKSGYSNSQSRTLTISSRGSIRINTNPKNQELNKAVEITVMDEDGKALTNAKVTITKPDGTIGPVMTIPSSGKISYVPRLVGTYSIRAEAERYETTTDSFRAQRAFSIIVPDVLEVNRDITVILSDSAGNAVEGAVVSVGGTSVSGKTDSAGRFAFKLSEPKEYTLTISKEGYATLSRKISTLGRLKITLDSNEIGLGDSVNIKIVDGQGNLVSAGIEITKPDGTKEVISGDSYTPSVSGNHGVTAIKKDYESDTESLMVRPAPLTLESRIRDNTLIVSVSSKGEALSNIKVQVGTPSWRKDIVTDDTGTGSLYLTNLELSSDITISVEKEGYEKKEITQKIPRFDLANYSIPVIFGLIIVITIVIILIASGSVGKGGKRGGGKGPTKSKARSGLGKV